MLHKENCFIAEIEGIFDRKILEEANNISFVCTSLAIGSDRQLGKVLLETYIYTLSELEFLPKNIFLGSSFNTTYFRLLSLFKKIAR